MLKIIVSIQNKSNQSNLCGKDGFGRFAVLFALDKESVPKAYRFAFGMFCDE